MPLVQAQCTNCGAGLAVDNEKDAAVCPFCNQAYIVEKAINNFNTTVNNTFVGANVNIVGKEDFEIRGGVLEKYNGNSTKVIIPDSVLIIGNEVFSGCVGIKEVIIPDTVTEIGVRAFAKCTRLEKISLSSELKVICSGAFMECENLDNVVIPKKVKAIGARAFSDCKSLTNIRLPEGLEKLGYNSINNYDSIHFSESINQFYCFYRCEKLQEIIIPSTIKVIEIGTFHSCKNLKTVIFNEGLEVVHFSAFWYCDKLEEIVLPSTVNKLSSKLEHCDATVIASEELLSKYWTLLPEEQGDFYSPPVTYDYKKKSGCYIATAVYGSYDCPEVWTLRRFRDNFLSKSWYGRIFIKIYYTLSPIVVSGAGHTHWFNRFFKKKLDYFVGSLRKMGYQDTPYYD